MNPPTSGAHCTTHIINVLPESVQNQLSEAWNEEIQLYPQTIENNFSSRVLRLNQEKIQIACQISGCKPTLAKTISDSILSYYRDLVRKLSSQFIFDPLQKYSIYTTNEKFIELLTKKLAEHEFTKKRNIYDFEIGLSIMEHTRPMIVLLGGTSGSGKSTVSSLLASRFGVSTVLSTDTIRHIMRNFMTTDECPILFASTYEAGNKIKVEEGTPEKKKVIMGFKQQASAVQEKLDNIIQGFYSRGESIIIEGVHLTPDFMASMITKYNNCIPFLVYIRSENKHRERFAVRSKYMTLEKKHNKYIQHFANIRDIQKHLTKKADEYLIPKVNNSNIDKSVGIIHRTVIRCLRKIAMGENLFDPEKKNGLKIYLQFNEVTKNIWSSGTAMEYINVKMSKANRTENAERFLLQDNDDVTKVEEEEIGVGEDAEEEDQGDSEGKEGEKDDEIEASQINVEQDKLGKIDPQFKYKEDLLFNEDTYANARSQLSALSKKKQSEKLVGSDLEQEKNGSKKNVTSEQQPTKPKGPTLEPEEEKSLEGLIEVGGPGSKGKLTGASPSFVAPKIKPQQGFMPLQNVETPTSKEKILTKLRELEEILNERRSVAIKGPLPQYLFTKIRKFLEYYNKQHTDSVVKVYPQLDRYVVYKHSRSDANSQQQLGTVNVVKYRRFPILFPEIKNTGKFTESGTSDGDVDGSDDENSEEKNSNLSGSMDAFHLTGRHHLSDYQDFSDDFESVAKLDEDDRSGGGTSLEIVDSANSISEQSQEDMEDEEDVIMDKPPKLIK